MFTLVAFSLPHTGKEGSIKYRNRMARNLKKEWRRITTRGAPFEKHPSSRQRKLVYTELKSCEQPIRIIPYYRSSIVFSDETEYQRPEEQIVSVPILLKYYGPPLFAIRRIPSICSRNKIRTPLIFLTVPIKDYQNRIYFLGTKTVFLCKIPRIIKLSTRKKIRNKK